jgi:inner membrane protein
LRIGLQEHATRAVRAAYPEASAVSVFPQVLSVSSFRYVAKVLGGHAAGEVGVVAPVRETVQDLQTHREPDQQFRRHLLSGIYQCDSPYCVARRASRTAPALREALDWARFPVVRQAGLPSSGTRFEVSDLRYYWGGKPTLTFVVDLDERREQVAARLDRGGTARELFERWRR